MFVLWCYCCVIVVLLLCYCVVIVLLGSHHVSFVLLCYDCVIIVLPSCWCAILVMCACYCVIIMFFYVPLYLLVLLLFYYGETTKEWSVVRNIRSPKGVNQYGRPFARHMCKTQGGPSRFCWPIVAHCCAFWPCWRNHAENHPSPLTCESLLRVLHFRQLPYREPSNILRRKRMLELKMSS